MSVMICLASTGKAISNFIRLTWVYNLKRQTKTNSHKWLEAIVIYRNEKYPNSEPVKHLNVRKESQKPHRLFEITHFELNIFCFLVYDRREPKNY